MPMVMLLGEFVVDFTIHPAKTGELAVVTLDGKVRVFRGTDCVQAWETGIANARICWAHGRVVVWGRHREAQVLLPDGGAISFYIPESSDLVWSEGRLVVASPSRGLLSFHFHDAQPFSLERLQPLNSYRHDSLNAASGALVFIDGNRVHYQHEPDAPWQVQELPAQAIALARDGSSIAVVRAGGHAQLSVFPIRGGLLGAEQRGLTAPLFSSTIAGIDWSFDNRLLLAVGSDGELEVRSADRLDLQLTARSVGVSRFSSSSEIVMGGPKGLRKVSWMPQMPRLWLHRRTGAVVPRELDLSATNLFRKGDAILLFVTRPAMRPGALYEVTEGRRGLEEDEGIVTASCKLRVEFNSPSQGRLWAARAEIESLASIVTEQDTRSLGVHERVIQMLAELLNEDPHVPWEVNRILGADVQARQDQENETPPQHVAPISVSEHARIQSDFLDQVAAVNPTSVYHAREQLGRALELLTQRRDKPTNSWDAEWWRQLEFTWEQDIKSVLKQAIPYVASAYRSRFSSAIDDFENRVQRQVRPFFDRAEWPRTSRTSVHKGLESLTNVISSVVDQLALPSSSVHSETIPPFASNRSQVDQARRFIDLVPRGEGAYANVWKAYDTRLERTVALRIVRASAGGDDEAVAHARTMAKPPQHPNIVTVYELVLIVDPTDKRPVVAAVMEFVDGGKLTDLWRSRLSTADARRICEGMIAAVEQYHINDLAHLDLHGGNILISRTMEAKVNDPKTYSGASIPTTAHLRDQKANDLSSLSFLIRQTLVVSELVPEVSVQFSELASGATSISGVRSAFTGSFANHENDSIRPASRADPLRERRASAAQDLWNAVLAIRTNIPLVLSELDLVTEDEYPRALQSDDMKQCMNLMTDDAIRLIASPENDHLERCRPLVGDAVWNRFHAYRALVARMCFVVRGRIGASRPWYRERRCLDLLSTALGGADVSHTADLDVGKLNQFRTRFESEFVAVLAPFLSS